MKPIETGIDKYQLEKEDIEEAISDLMKKRNLGEVVKVTETKVHIPGRAGDIYDEGYDETVYNVDVKRKGVK